MYETAREDVRRHKERLEIKREQEIEEADLQPQRSRTKKQETSQRRQDRKVSGVAFGGNTGIPQSVLSDWKRGRSNVKTDKLKILADYFGVSIEYFLE